MIAAALLLAQAPVAAVGSAICTNNSVFEVKEDETVSVTQIGVETAVYSVTAAKGAVQISESGIFARWHHARRMTLPSHRVVLMRRLGKLSYAFTDGAEGDKPQVIVSGRGLTGTKADVALLDRIHLYPAEQAEKDPRCGRVLHYGWENILGPST